MSTPRCLRIAVEACRPCKSSVLRSRLSLHHRCYATKPISSGIDITAGFPTPEVSETNSTSQPQEPVSTPTNNVTPEVISNKPKHESTARQEKSRQPKEKTISATKTKEPARAPSKTASKPMPEQSITSAIPQAEVKTEQEPEQDLPSTKPFPPNVVAAYRTPMRYPAEHRIPVGSLQLRSYSVRNLEFFADFAMRAAFYLQLPASGPVPLPRIVERWTVPRSNFVHKKAQENFERITMRRLITVMDGEKSVVETWLAFLRKWQFYGVGMKANVWEFEGLDVGKKMDRDLAAVEKELDHKLANFGFNKSVARDKSLQRMMDTQGVKHVGVPGTYVRPQSTTADQRI